ncbi:MAG: glycosyltransferase family 4 protein [Prolixibacteraceae bacterium]
MRDNEEKRKSILFVYTSFSSFVKNDYETLNANHLVAKYHFAPVKGILRNVLEILKQLLYLLIHGWKYDIFFCWFSDYHSFLPVLFAKITGKKSVIIIGGYDVCRIRKLNYGAFCSSFRGWFCAKSMRLASWILPVSKYVERKAQIIAPRTRCKMIYNCVSLDNPGDPTSIKTDTVLTVGLISNERTFYTKGIDTFIEVARLLPGLSFQVVGINRLKLEHKLGNLPSNLALFEKVNPQELTAFYKNAKIYCQLSRSESFGVSIAEAMKFGAFPVVTNEGGMPEIVGITGAVVNRDLRGIANLIEDRILKEGAPYEIDIRMQVGKFFSQKQRQESLFSVINSD